MFAYFCKTTNSPARQLLDLKFIFAKSDFVRRKNSAFLAWLLFLGLSRGACILYQIVL